MVKDRLLWRVRLDFAGLEDCQAAAFELQAAAFGFGVVLQVGVCHQAHGVAQVEFADVQAAVGVAYAVDTQRPFVVGRDVAGVRRGEEGSRGRPAAECIA